MNKNNSKQKQEKKHGKRIGAIVGLSLALSFAVAAAITVPLVVKKPGSDPTTITHSVTFDANGGTFGDGSNSKSQKVVDNELILAPACSKDGSYLSGWFNGDTEWNFNTNRVTSNITLKARWTTSPVVEYHTVTFKANGGSFDSGSGDIKTDIKLNEKIPFAPACKRAQYNLTSWNTAAGKEWDFKNDVVTQDVTLIAQWADVPTTVYHTVTFESEGTTYTTQAVEEGKYAVEPKSPTHSGSNWQFDYWHKKGDENNPFNFATTAINADLTLVAKFHQVEVVSHTITFKSGTNGKFAGESVSETKVVQDDPFFFTIAKPTVTANTGYTHVGWVDSKGNDLDKVQITSDITAIADYIEEPKYVNLSLKTDFMDGSYTVAVQGTDTYSWNLKEQKKYTDIKNGLSVAKCDPKDHNSFVFSNWSTTPQTDLNTCNPEPSSTSPLEGDITLYPQFTPKAEIQTVTLTVHLGDGQHIRSGSETIEVNYQEGGPNNKTFGEVTKPEIYKEGEVFEGYYQDDEYKTAWDPEEPIVPNLAVKDIYVKTVSADSRVSVNFAVEDTTVGNTYTWIGNHEDIRCEAKTKLSDIAVPNVYKNATEDPDPTIGFATDYVFTNWYYKNKDGQPVDIENLSDYTIEKNVTFYAKFEKKTEVVVQIDEQTPTPTTTSFLAIPSTKWDNIVKPDFTTSSPSTRFLVGWQAQDAEGNWIPLQAETKISDIKLASAAGADKVTTTVLPIISEDVHIINFDKNAKVEGEDDTQEVFLKGNLTTYVDRTKDYYINATVNKPILPKSDEGVAKNEDFTFNNKWQIKDGTVFTDWTDVTDTTKLPKGDQVTFTMRPVVTRNVSVTYDTGADGTIEGTESKTTKTIKVGSSDKFTSIYKPTVLVKEPTKNVFSHWAKQVGEKLVEVSPNDNFEKDTTLYAVYDKKEVCSTIQYKVHTNDLEDPDFPAQPINEDNCFEVSKLHDPDKDVYVSEFADKIPTKKKHSFLCWGIENDEGEVVEIDPTKTVVPQGDPLILYAMFKPNAVTYHKVTIKEDPTNYTIEGSTSFFVGDDENMPINDISGDIELEKDDSGKVTSSTFAWTVGKVLTGWKDKDGNLITSATKVTADLEDITPVFKELTKTEQPTIKFLADLPGATPSGAKIDDSTPRYIPINDKLNKYLAGEVAQWAAPSVTPKAKSAFDKWKIVNKDGTTSDITSETRVTKDLLTDNTLTLVATFIDESIYEGIDGAYFYDTEREQWGAIQSYFTESSAGSLKVQYQNGETVDVPKSTFNYEIKFGAQTTEIPDYFMYGCANWNNGEKTLKLPSNIKSIGKNVMAGCSSFNQAIECEVSSADLPDYSGIKCFVIGENFMKNCYLFNNNITMTYAGPASTEKTYIVFGESFMSECQSLGKTSTTSINLSGWVGLGYKDTFSGQIRTSASKEWFYSSLSTTRPAPYTINMIVENNIIQKIFNDTFIDLDGTTTPYYRKMNITVKA